jgi:hypothetical protein
LLEVDIEEIDDIINMFYSINPNNLAPEQYEAVERVISWLVLMLEEADEAPGRGQ